MSPPSRPERSSTPESIFAGYLERKHAGASLEFADVCNAHPEHAQALRRLYDEWEHAQLEEAPRTVTLDPGGSGPSAPSAESAAQGGAAESLLERLGTQPPKGQHYRLDGELARGGMGAILKVWDENLRRHLVMKVILGDGATGAIDHVALARFLEEAQITGQLDHPGIVPVHELGLDRDGRIFFTMKLVKGRDLKRIFELVHGGDKSWNETRALSVILKVCEAMAFSHAKGVLHRDLKPANVMVGNYGEVFVMDWGLARVVGHKDTRDIRIRPEFTEGLTSIRTDRRDKREESADSPILTMGGDVMGTPAYMPPEQAFGEVDKLTARSDVYAVGAMLYHLLARQMPYVQAGRKITSRTILTMVLQGPPASLTSLRKDLPAELVAICEKAMAREQEDRYPNMLALAEDLRAYLEQRVVTAYETGAWAQLRKWIVRNKPLAAASVFVLATTIASLFFAARATKNAGIADARAEDVDLLSTSKHVEHLVARADELWPATPQNQPAFNTWLDEARELIEGRPADGASRAKRKPGLDDYRKKLNDLTKRAKGSNARSHDAGTSDLEFADAVDTWWYERLTQLVASLEHFSDPNLGLYSSGVSPEHGWGVAKRSDFARTIAAKSIEDDEPHRRWAEAIASIRSEKKCPKYDGLDITPQLGLVPIGQDKESELWEFAHLQSGAPAVRGLDGKLVLAEDTGLVFVLIPGGTFRMGAQSKSASDDNFDPQAKPDDPPVRKVTLNPYFISKYEMTQGQWSRFTGSNPSYWGIGGEGVPNWNAENTPPNLLHPVEYVTWFDCVRTLKHMDMCLPTEAQWEHAARAGTFTPWWAGRDIASLNGTGNLLDEYAATTWADMGEGDKGLDDGYVLHAPVGHYRANGFGLYDVIGNVWEWCVDGYDGYEPIGDGSGGKRGPDTDNRFYRGGDFANRAVFARSALRFKNAVSYRYGDLGLRPAKELK